jgi:two-component system, cell cycle response regulator
MPEAPSQLLIRSVSALSHEKPNSASAISDELVPQRTAEASEPSGETFKVLVADDSAVYRKLLQQTLSSDYSILMARSAEEALQLYESEHPSLVITDWVMPDMTGIELCQRIRSNVRARYTYIILLTTIAEKENIVRGLTAGADDYLTKPFHQEELLARVRVGCRLMELHRQLEAKNRLLEELALTDPLTKLPNRRAIEDWARRQLSGAARHGFPFWVVLIDLDHFKRVNDTYGHDAGDLVLQRLSEILKLNTRLSDICGRIGGEEFLQVLTYADEPSIRMVVERVRKQFAAEPFSFGGESIKVTASFGVAGFQGRTPPPFSELVTQADAALYRAKNAGRNCAEIVSSRQL